MKAKGKRKLEEGYYWTQLKSSEKWIVGLYFGGMFHLCGIPGSCYESDLGRIGPRIAPPKGKR